MALCLLAIPPFDRCNLPSRKLLYNLACAQSQESGGQLIIISMLLHLPDVDLDTIVVKFLYQNPYVGLDGPTGRELGIRFPLGETVDCQFAIRVENDSS